jgi:phosphoribosyl 1,2-cyclic phosphate phosphodiesterase
MKFRYLGTGDSNAVPALFCRCPLCTASLKAGARALHSRSQALVDGKILLDYPPDSYHHYLQGWVDLPSIKHILVTHSHEDHFSPDDFISRNYRNRDGYEGFIELYGNAGVGELIYQIFLARHSFAKSLHFNHIGPSSSFSIGEYRVQALPAFHMQEAQEKALLYAIEKEEGERKKTIFYAHDTAALPEEVYRLIKEKGLHFDFVSLDCTYPKRPAASDWGHMSLADNVIVRQRLYDMGAADEKTLFYVSHLSHHGLTYVGEMEELALANGFAYAYDGLEIEF